MIVMFKKHTWKWSAIAAVLLIGAGIIGLTGAKGAASFNNKDTANILSKNTIDFNKDSHNESLIVKMTEGRYYEDTNPGPYMGSNWEGKFYIQLINDKGNVISELDLNKAFNEQVLCFQGVFNVEFDDYNNDCNFDFTIGQYASSNGNAYRLFEILPDGKIEPLAIQGQSEIFSSGENKYSKKFEKIDMASFKNQYYDNSKGLIAETCYLWSNSENQFIIKPLNSPTEEGTNNILSDWIKSTTPQNGDTNLQPKSNISIEFNQDMDGSTLNANNIVIIEEKHCSNISEMFQYDYNPSDKVLSITFKNPESDYGTGNAVNITVTGKIRNSKGQAMEKDYAFGFSVK